MVTANDIRRIRIFTELDRAACERLSRAAADISLAAGEYAAHEGDERAFALLEGGIEAVKVVDGIDRVVGERPCTSSFAGCWSWLC
jgi:thioredoxin reductase (NADPH)